MAILAGLYEEVYAGNTAAQVISVLCLFLFNSWFSVGWLGMTWLYPAEITPLRIRAVSPAFKSHLRYMIQADLLFSLPMVCQQRQIGCSTSLVRPFGQSVVVPDTDSHSRHGYRTHVCNDWLRYICILCR